MTLRTPPTPPHFPFALAGTTYGHFYLGVGTCRNSEGEWPTHWEGWPTGTKVSDCEAICARVGVAKCTGYAHKASTGYCYVFGKGLPTMEEQPDGNLDGLTRYFPRTGVDDEMVKTGGQTGIACYSRKSCQQPTCHRPTRPNPPPPQPAPCTPPACTRTRRATHQHARPRCARDAKCLARAPF